MTTRGDRKAFRNEDLVLKVTPNIDPSVWDDAKYEGFLDELIPAGRPDTQETEK